MLLNHCATHREHLLKEEEMEAETSRRNADSDGRIALFRFVALSALMGVRGGRLTTRLLNNASALYKASSTPLRKLHIYIE